MFTLAATDGHKMAISFSELESLYLKAKAYLEKGQD